MRVLLIDGDADLTTMLDDYLSRDGFDVAAVHDSTSGIAHALSGSYAIVVLDEGMAGLGGIDMLERIRRESQVPVLMLSAGSTRGDRIRGLELGADDYVPKPCAPRELAARIRAILRRTRGAAAPLAFGLLSMWPERREAQWDGQPIDLTSTEFNLLEVLVRNAGSPVSKQTLSEQGLGRPLAPYDRNIDVHLSSVRRKLGASSSGRSCIQTVQRVGYQFVPDR
jgi:two-component system OmpR family response regulator